MAKNGEMVAAFEREFAAFVGATYAIALCNGTATLHTALVALGVQPGSRVFVPPLTMSATTIAVLHAQAIPVFNDVDQRTWLMKDALAEEWSIPVSLYGLQGAPAWPRASIDDAAQTLRRCSDAAFTSFSFQNSKILALGEGGMLVTNSEYLATRAREFSSVGYRMRADQPRINANVLKSPTFDRHYSLGWNYRMNDVTAAAGLQQLECATIRLDDRKLAASFYRNAMQGCEWITPQFVPNGWTHDYWSFAVALDSAERLIPFMDLIEKYGGERPYPAWRLTYQEPAFRHLAPDGTCPIAESLQPRLVQFQTNDLASAEKNARAVQSAIAEMGDAYRIHGRDYLSQIARRSRSSVAGSG